MYVGVIQVATLLLPKPPLNDHILLIIRILVVVSVLLSFPPGNFSLALLQAEPCVLLCFLLLCLPLRLVFFFPGLGSAGFSLLGYPQDILLNGNFGSYSLLVILLGFAPRAIFFSQQNDTPKGVSKRNSPR